jgi:hypothetical protein
VKSPLLLSADSLMEIYPDSALSILESISSPQKLPRADRALYALFTGLNTKCGMNEM